MGSYGTPFFPLTPQPLKSGIEADVPLYPISHLAPLPTYHTLNSFISFSRSLHPQTLKPFPSNKPHPSTHTQRENVYQSFRLTPRASRQVFLLAGLVPVTIGWVLWKNDVSSLGLRSVWRSAYGSGGREGELSGMRVDVRLVRIRADKGKPRMSSLDMEVKRETNET